MAARLLVRPMRPTDLAAVMAIERGTVSPWTEQQLAAQLSQAAGWQLVAEAEGEGRVVGYICGMAVAPEAEIFKIAVASEYRRQGVGRALVQEAAGRLRRQGIQACYLELRQSNQAARGLYEEAGFTMISARRKYYSAPQEDAVVMRKIMEEGKILEEHKRH